MQTKMRMSTVCGWFDVLKYSVAFNNFKLYNESQSYHIAPVRISLKRFTFLKYAVFRSAAALLNQR